MANSNNSKSTSTLFIIGNGFDLNHGYRTDYESFRDYLKAHTYTVGSFDLYNLFDEMGDDEWRSFEENLAYLDFESWASDYTSDLSDEELSDREFEREYSRNSDLLDSFNEIKEKLYPALCCALRNFVLDTVTAKASSKKYFNSSFNKSSKEDTFISFNYTRTLETLYGIDKNQITYLHGIASSYFPSPDEREQYDEAGIVFGHGEKQSEVPEDFEADAEFDLFNPEKTLKYLTNSLCKQYCFDEFDDAVQRALDNNLSEVQIIGHSLGSVDKSYFEHLKKKIGSNIKIVYWLYNEEDQYRMQKILENLFPKNQISFRCYA